MGSYSRQPLREAEFSCGTVTCEGSKGDPNMKHLLLQVMLAGASGPVVGREPEANDSEG